METILEDIVIIDMSTGIAGAYASMLMAEQGAECIKVEPLEGDPARELPGFMVWNRSKKGIKLNLATEEGQNVVHRLVERADVIIESYSPGQAQQLGYDYETISAINKRIIYCAIPLLGEKGPLKEKQGNNDMVAAYCGNFASQGGLEKPPVFLKIPLPSYGAAFLAAYGISTALYVREETGMGQKVDVSLMAGGLAMEAGALISSEQIIPLISDKSIQQGVMPVYRLYECQDEWLMLACGNQTFWNKLVIAMDRVDLIADPRFEGAPWGIPEVENREALTEILAGIFRQKPRAYWLELLGNADVPCAPVNSRTEFMKDPQVLHNQMITDVIDPEYGPTRQMNISLEFGEYPGKIKGPAPMHGEHTRSVLKEFGFSDTEVDMLEEKRVI